MVADLPSHEAAAIHISCTWHPANVVLLQLPRLQSLDVNLSQPQHQSAPKSKMWLATGFLALNAAHQVLGLAMPRNDTTDLGSSRGHGHVIRTLPGHLDAPYETSSLGGDPHDTAIYGRAFFGDSPDDVFILEEEETFGPNARMLCDKLPAFGSTWSYRKFGTLTLFELKRIHDRPPPTIEPGTCKHVACQYYGELWVCNDVGSSSVQPFLFASNRY